jgi:hypothetical protein
LRCLQFDRESRWTRHALVAESPLNCGAIKRPGRPLSSARPLPEEDLPDHHQHPFWSDSPSESPTSKRASFAKIRRKSPRIERPKSPSTSSVTHVNSIAPVTDVHSTRPIQSFEELESNGAFHAFVNAVVPPEASLAALQTKLPKELRYTGDAVIPITSILHIVKPQDDVPRGIWPVFRLMVRRCCRCSIRTP